MKKITWGLIGDKGRGVFALADAQTHEVLEVSPVRLISEEDAGTDALDTFNMEWRHGDSCVGFGYLMLYNHSASPNVCLARDFKANTISVIARREIKAGEELTYDYGVPLWFDPL